MFSVKGQIVNFFGRVDLMVCDAAVRFCLCSAKAAIGNTRTGEHGCCSATLSVETGSGLDLDMDAKLYRHVYCRRVIGNHLK